jgi:hypothetical protein
MEGLRMKGGKGQFGGTCKMEVCLEALLELCFWTKPPNFGVEAHIEAPTGVALSPIRYFSDGFYRNQTILYGQKPNEKFLFSFH